MTERIRWTTRNSQKILIHDFTGLTPDEALMATREMDAYLTSHDLLDVRFLIDVTGIYASPQLVKEFKENGRTHRHRFRRIAVLGIEGILRLFFNTVNRFARTSATPFDDMDRALDWLSEN